MRNIEPAIYNEDRLNEQPIPNIPDEIASETESDQSDNEEEAPEEVLFVAIEPPQSNDSSAQGIFTVCSVYYD